MKDCLVRIDNRLVHGQILEAWIPHLNAECIAIVDDDVAYNPFRETVIRMVVPREIELKVFSASSFIEENKNCPFVKSERTIFLLSNTSDVLDIFTNGFAFNKLNIGNLCSDVTMKNCSSCVSLNKLDIDNLNSLLAASVSVELQKTPTDEIINLEKILAEYR